MRLITRRTFSTGLTALGASVALTGRASAQSQASFTIPEGVTHGGPTTITRVPTEQPLVAMTFDDGPRPRTTPRVLKVLEAEEITGTFFICGRLVRRFPEIFKDIVAAGHQLANHTWSHPNLADLTKKESI